MKQEKGITLIALIITIILLLLLATVVMSTFKEGNIISNSEKAVEMHKIESVREEIQMAIIRKTIVSDREITIEQIIEELEKQGIINSGDGNSETGQVKTQPDGYIYEIKEKANGDFEVIYIGKGELTLPELLITLSPNTTGITSSVTITMTAKAKSGITSYTLPKGTEQSVESGTKEITKTYTATENGTYTFTVTNGNGKTESKSITIDNILEGTIQISANPTTPTKGNVTVTVTWPRDASRAIKEIQVGEGSWEVCTGEVNTVEVMVNCTIKARVRNSIEEIKTATCTINNIDKTNPTVTAKTGTVTIKEGDSHSLEEYFTVVANGIYGIASTVYTDTSNGNAGVANTNTLAVGTHVIKCTATKETGASASATKIIVVEQNEPDGSESNPYVIQFIEDLVDLSIAVNNGETYEGKYIKLMRSLDFQDTNSYRNANDTSYGDLNTVNGVQTIKEEFLDTTGVGFTVIGKPEWKDGQSVGKAFAGVFLGNGNEIKNVYINYNVYSETDLSIGFFCLNEGEIKDLIVSGTFNRFSGPTGGIVGENRGIIKNCTNKISITLTENTGLGYGEVAGISSLNNGIIENCSNHGNLEVQSTNLESNYEMGGIAGINNGTIKDCYNDATVYSAGLFSARGNSIY